MSRLINIDPQVQQDSEPEGYEFGYCPFDTLPPVEISNINATQDNSDHINDDNNLIDLPIKNDTLCRLQPKNEFCANILVQVEKGNIVEGQIYIIQDKLLKQYVMDGNNTY